ncbi:DEAD/DEAH box helicase [Vibrio vulnificus]|uniref:DEAD/DEAH box helicase family protein n=1 Tax=Vibrio vulnificus TaxID=672 RepID=UPI001A2CE67C|nr:DEAD/DEAH box helicase family protein [Vibrio vulnificus]MCA3959861.1 DEAD/DEAH box helicase [Vibrio vulnificus]HAS6022495.1 DEAD/DEAH box helicase [Vibrio vulnificus]HAS6032987.1 DEAD/DEAH box helicase [Vibrio vulnificus]HDY7839498.1 DEAD/DEAH box helicase [Vibrio vulnificus]HDY8008747.1 DEAD/DEAH box helicase [Vibrio vulnificus]
MNKLAISFNWLKDDDKFLSSMKKMSLNIPLDTSEMEYLLSCAVIFLEEYRKDKRKNLYFEIAYFIVLKSAINNGEYEPLLDVSSNFGLYPISNYITKNNLFTISASSEFSLSYQLRKFEYNSIIETYEQKKSRLELVNSNDEENCYIAPTSFGKSSLITEIIREKQLKKVAIIVPTKSLLIQTYKLVKNNFLSRNIIFHDEMYDGSDDFIAIFTQERALRLLKDESISFDLLIIDEAHNLFNYDSRSLLLTRLIRRNRNRNPKSVNYYLSPLISDSNNLRVENEQEIFERKIISNIKEADIYEYKESGEVRKYNRFLDVFFESGYSENFLSYIIENSKDKNFLYLRAPKRVEELSILLDSKLEFIGSPSLMELSDVISMNVHKDFYCVDYIKKGLVYLHGKLPDLIKEYLEFKFSENKEVKYVVANSVILEGVNLPVDNMYIMNTNSLDAKSLTNLIGRVNRLNEVFDDERRSLDKLMPSVHFVNSEDFNRKGGNMENQIRKLKSGVFKDTLENPLLVNFDIDKMKLDLEKAREENKLERVVTLERKLDEYQEIKGREDFLITSELDSHNRVKKVLLESDILSVYFNSEQMINKLSNKVDTIVQHPTWKESHIIDRVYLLFIQGLESYIVKKDFLRLQHEKARDFYKMFTGNLHRLSLKEHISDTIRYFQSIKYLPQGREFYIGESYGEVGKINPDGKFGKAVYLDLATKSNKELANISLVKIKIESDFVSYTLNNFVNVMYDLDIISEEEYELYIYGTTNKSNSEFVKLGFSGSLINRLDRDKQMSNLSINDHGLVEYNDDFVKYINVQDDLIKFEIGKFIEI